MTAGRDTVRRSIRSSWIWLVPALFAFLLYLPSLLNGFVLDDLVLLKDSRLGSLRSFFDIRPGELVVRYWSLLIDSVIWGRNPAGYHLTNALLHAATTAVLCLWVQALLRRTAVAGRRRGPDGRFPDPQGIEAAALVSALVFAAHPMQTEAVAGVTHRKEVLSTLFVLIALLRSLPPLGKAETGAARDGEKSPARREGRGAARAAELGLWVGLALFAKATAVVVFPMVLLQDLWVNGSSVKVWVRRDLPRYLPAVLSLTMLVVYRWSGIEHAAGPDPMFFKAYNPQAVDLSATDRIATSFSVLGLYWRLLVFPWRPTLERFVEPSDFGDPMSWAALLAAAALLVLAARWGRRRPLLALGLAWLVLAPVPTLNFLPLNFLFSERYLYLPSVGLMLVLAPLVRAWGTRTAGSRRRIPAAGLALALVMSPLTVTRVLEWRDTDTLFRATLRDNPRSPKVLFLHAHRLRDAGRIPESLEAAQAGLRRLPVSPDGWHLVGRAHADMGRDGDALVALAQAVTLARKPPATWLNDYAVALIRNGRPVDAVPVLEEALERQPIDFQAGENYLRLLILRPELRDRGIRFLDDKASTRAEDPWFRVLVVEAAMLEGDLVRAAGILDEAGRRVVDPSVLAFLDALRLEVRGEIEAARRAYRVLREDGTAPPGFRAHAEMALSRLPGG